MQRTVGGEDSFDCMGRVRVNWSDQSILLNVSLGVHSLQLTEHTSLWYSSDKAHSNIWRLRFWTVGVPLTDQELTIEVFGNLGFDRRTTVSFGQLEIDGYSVPYWWYTDDLRVPVKPPVLHLAIPHHGLSAAQVTASLNVNQVNLAISDTQTPITYYLASSYLPREVLLNAIQSDLILDDDRGEIRGLPSELTISIEAQEE